MLTLEDLNKIEKKILLKYIYQFFSCLFFYDFFGYMLDSVLVATNKAVNKTDKIPSLTELY